MDISLYPVEITTDASGDFTTTIEIQDGLFSQLRYVPDGGSPLDTGADITVSDPLTGLVYYTQSNIGVSAFTRLARQLIADGSDGTVSTDVYDYVMARGNIQVTVAQGGNALSGKLYLWVSH